MDTNPIPSSGQPYIPVAPEETKNANVEELRKAEQALPFVDGVSQWFADAIEATNHIDVALAEAKRRQISVEVAVQAYDMVAEILAQKKGEFDSLKMTFEK